MAPEILLHRPYDAQKADVWSLAIMYCCMILGRFPWKVAALSDESFSLFATTKRPNLHAERGMGRSASAPLSLQPPKMAGVSSYDLKAETTVTVSVVDVTLDNAVNTNGAERGLEPCRLLSKLPSKNRELIRNMLLPNAQSRPTLQRINEYPWIQQSQLCSQDDGIAAHYGPQHEHVLRD